jgi:hypothetical protein
MKGSIEIKPNGEVTLSINEGSTFENGKQRILELQAMLAASGVPVELAGPVEQHRHDDTQAHITEQTHSHTGSADHRH